MLVRLFAAVVLGAILGAGPSLASPLIPPELRAAAGCLPISKYSTLEEGAGRISQRKRIWDARHRDCDAKLRALTNAKGKALEESSH